MTIQARTWRRFGYIGSILAIPCTIYLFWEPDLGSLSYPLEILAYTFMFSLGIIGALLAIFTRSGHVTIIHRDEDKGHWNYRLGKIMAEMESNRGRPFSQQYYKSFDVDPPQKESTPKDSSS